MKYTFTMPQGSSIMFSTSKVDLAVTVCKTARAFVAVLIKHNTTSRSIKVDGDLRFVIDIEELFELFCVNIFSVEDEDENSTSLWKDPKTGKFYICAYGYDSFDYYQTASGYFKEIEINKEYI